MVLARAQTFAPYPKDQGQTRHLLPDWGAVTLAWSPRVNIRAKYEVTSEFNPRGGQVLLSHSKDAVLFHPHHRACHPLPLYHLIKEFTGKVFANHSLSPATRRGAILSLWVAGH